MKMLKFIINNKYNDYIDSRTVMPPAKLYEITQNLHFLQKFSRHLAYYKSLKHKLTMPHLAKR